MGPDFADACEAVSGARSCVRIRNMAGQMRTAVERMCRPAILPHGMAGQAIDPRLVVLQVQETASPGHGRNGFGNRQSALLQKFGKCPRLARIHAGERACQILQMHGREVDRIVIVARHDRADHMATPELAAHGIADSLATASQYAN